MKLSKTEALARRMHDLQNLARKRNGQAISVWERLEQYQRDIYLYVSRGLLRDRAKERRVKR